MAGLLGSDVLGHYHSCVSLNFAKFGDSQMTPQNVSSASLTADPLWAIYLQERDNWQNDRRGPPRSMHDSSMASIPCWLAAGERSDNSTVAGAPHKPPGVFQKVSSTTSLASTVDTVAEEVEAVKTALSLHESEHKTSGQKKRRQELFVENCGNGHLKVQWWTQSSKLRSRDKQIVSPNFSLFPGSSFKIMLKPKSVGDKKNQGSFSKARGSGSMELKLMETGIDTPVGHFYVSVGESVPLGPVVHDFSNSAVCGLTKKDEVLEFSAAVDRESSTFCVSLDAFFDVSRAD
jgi:hypothetical protein